MDEKNVFRLDETILHNRKKSMEDTEIIIDMDEPEVVQINDDEPEPGETIHIEIGEMDYDPEDGRWKDSDHGWRVREVEEKEADYRQIPDHETLKARALADKSGRKKTRRKAGQKTGEGKSKKELPLYLQVIYGLVAIACLGFCFVYPDRKSVV